MESIPRPTSEHLEPAYADRTRVAVMAASLIIIIVFTYLSYLAWSFTKGTPLAGYSLVIMAPVIVSAFLLVFLMTIGRRGFHKEYKELKRYKVRFSKA